VKISPEHQISPVARALTLRRALMVEMMGGPENIIKRGRELFDEGKYRHAQEILNKLVWAESDNQEGKDLLADIWEQIGYQQENPGLRNSFLAGALALRSASRFSREPRGRSGRSI
jgi:alkyl sulfatase BDS1-like metallo-beta-lactamase superfamily hydrolase